MAGSIYFFQTNVNFFTWFLFNFFLLLALFAAFMVVFSLSPVSSVLYLILVFASVALLFILVGAEFLGIILILVYVGAVAVLFLFAVMMLNLGRVEFIGLDLYFLLSVFGAGAFFYVMRTSLLDFMVAPANVGVSLTSHVDWVVFLDWKTNVEVLGGLLYTYYSPLFILAGVILLIAMVASITLTQESAQVRSNKAQDKHNQIRKSALNSVKLRK
jgi:NADH-quinone oxidoreductase subunit J